MRILLADDHSLFRDGVASLLQAAGFEVVGQVGDGQAAVEAARRLRPDVALLDISMPHMSGLEALRQIKAESPEVKVVMLTVSEDKDDLFQSARAGANGYLLKSINAQQFVELLKGLEQGEVAMTRQTMALLMEGFAESTQGSSDTPDTLTPREMELLKWVAHGLSNKAIAHKLSLSENTVKYHLKNIMQKLKVQNRTEAAAYALRAGLVSSHGDEAS